MPLLRRDKHAFKNKFGHLLVAAGSPSMLGAACLVSLAAMRFGTGLVTAAIPGFLNLTLQRKISHAVMTLPLPGGRPGIFRRSDAGVISASWNKFTAFAVGPGIGLFPSTIKFVRTIIRECPLPMVIDADALNALAGDLDILRGSKVPRVLTPHPGEFFRLSGSRPSTDQERKKAARDFAVRNNVVLVLKGHRTVIASAEGKVYVNNTGNPGMAKAGMGDVLTGMIAALLAQGVEPFEAAKHAVYGHGSAGDRLLRRKKIYALTAMDLIDEI